MVQILITYHLAHNHISLYPDSMSDSEESIPRSHQDSDVSYFQYTWGFSITYGHQLFEHQSSQSDHDPEASNYSHISYAHTSDMGSSSHSSHYSAEQEYQSSQQIEQRRGGLDWSQIQQIPKMIWKADHAKYNKDEQCSICYHQYEVGNSLLVLHCLHRFHGQCIQKWLYQNSTCPECRLNIREIEGGSGSDTSA